MNGIHADAVGSEYRVPRSLSEHRPRFVQVLPLFLPFSRIVGEMSRLSWPSSLRFNFVFQSEPEIAASRRLMVKPGAEHSRTSIAQKDERMQTCSTSVPLTGSLFGSLAEGNRKLNASRSRLSKGIKLNGLVKHIGRNIIRSRHDVVPDPDIDRASSSSSCRLCAQQARQQDSACSRDEGCSHHHHHMSPRFSSAVSSNLNFLQDTTHKCRPGWTEESGRWIFGRVLDPRSKLIQMWNRVFLLVSSVGAAIDPLFLYVVSMHMELACIFVNKYFAVTVTIMRAFTDMMYLIHMWLQLRLAYVSKESLVLGTGLLVWDARKIATNYLRHSWAFIFDVFVILPIPQILFWCIVPAIINSGASFKSLLAVILVVFLFQYIPKILHMVLLIRRMQHVTGYIFGTAWWGFALNLIAYFVAAHIAGALWYLLTVNEIEECAVQRCWSMVDCNRRYFGCPRTLSYGDQPLLDDLRRAAFASDEYLQAQCLRNGGRFNYGIYRQAVTLPGESLWLDKVLYPLFWGLMTLSSFGNALIPGNEPLEVAFSIFVITCGLLLFMLLIGNIQVFLHSITARKEVMQLRIRDMEWWMKRRQLPMRLRQRVRHYERQRWAATRGVDETSMVADLPEGLRRDIKRHLCLDLVRQVPLFQQMDELVLDNVCERLTAHIFIKGEMVLREGDPVIRMLFLVRGHFQSSYRLKNNQSSYCLLGPGNFCGDELLSWCLRKTPVDRMPPSTATLIALDSAEVFALEARDLKFVVQHFRYKFEDENMKRTLRFYSSGWRMWAAVTIQLSWRRFKANKKAKLDGSLPRPSLFAVPESYINMADSEAAMRNNRLRIYTAVITSPKPSGQIE